MNPKRIGKVVRRAIDRCVNCKWRREKTGHGDATPHLNDSPTRRRDGVGERPVTTLRNQSSLIRAGVESQLDRGGRVRRRHQARVPAALFDVNGLVDRLIA